MVNIYFDVNENENADQVVYDICKHLAGTEAFINDEIFIPDAEENSILISLGKESQEVLEINAVLTDALAYRKSPLYYLSEENATGIKLTSKKDLLQRLSRRIDEIIKEDKQLDTIEIMIIK